MQKKYSKLLLSLVTTSILIAGCSSSKTPDNLNITTYYDTNNNGYFYCNAESCPTPTKFTLDNEDDEPIFIPPTPVAAEPLKVKENITVNFAFNKAVLTHKEKNRIINQFKNIDLANYHINIVGYTDNIEAKKGGLKYNSKLAYQRALVVSNLLVKEYKVNKKDIKIVSKPLCCYIDTNKTANGRQKNRRTTIEIKVK